MEVLVLVLAGLGFVIALLLVMLAKLLAKVRDSARETVRAEQDITDYRRRVVAIVSELQESKRKAEASAQFRSRFLANVSHEIRTPLTGIMGTHFLL
jgi:signal transduction histidine kinase